MACDVLEWTSGVWTHLPKPKTSYRLSLSLSLSLCHMYIQRLRKLILWRIEADNTGRDEPLDSPISEQRLLCEYVALWCVRISRGGRLGTLRPTGLGVTRKKVFAAQFVEDGQLGLTWPTKIGWWWTRFLTKLHWSWRTLGCWRSIRQSRARIADGSST